MLCSNTTVDELFTEKYTKLKKNHTNYQYIISKPLDEYKLSIKACKSYDEVIKFAQSKVKDEVKNFELILAIQLFLGDRSGYPGYQIQNERSLFVNDDFTLY